MRGKTFSEVPHAAPPSVETFCTHVLGVIWDVTKYAVGYCLNSNLLSPQSGHVSHAVTCLCTVCSGTRVC